MTDTHPSFARSGAGIGPLLWAPSTIVWFGLVGATLVSWYVGTDHWFDSPTGITIAVLLVAFVKVRFVGMYFMDLREAPAHLRMAFDGYCVLVCALIIGCYLLG
jgi:hypothetical protein